MNEGSAGSRTEWTETMTLREKVAEAMWDDSREYYMRIADIGPWEEADPPTVDFNLRQADAAIATVFEALLSDTAVDAAAEVMFNESQDYPAWDDLPDEWDSGYGLGKNFYRSTERTALKAAQSALTADDAQTGGE